MDARRFLKTVIGLVVLVGLLMLVLNWWGDYRAAQRASASKRQIETTATPSPQSSEETATDTPASPVESATKTVLVVQVPGLNFREEPSGTAKAYRGLKKGEKVVLLEQDGDWYKVEDVNGLVGYITANPAYTQKTQE